MSETTIIPDTVTPTVADIVASPAALTTPAAENPVIKDFNLPYLPKSFFMCPISKIKIRKVELKGVSDGGRVRKDFSLVPQLAESMKELGMIQPIIVEVSDKPEEYYWLLAGETRLRAAMIAGAKEVPVVLRDQATPRLAKAVELEENLRRRDMSYTERALGIEQLHLLKQSEFGEAGPGIKTGWTQENTASVVNESVGSVKRHLAIAQAIRDNPAMRAALEKMPMSAALQKLKNDKLVSQAQGKIESGELKITKDFRCGDALELIKAVADASINAIITDPPFGISTIDDELGETRGSSQTYTASLRESDNMNEADANKLIAALAPELFRVAKPGAFVYMFCSITVFPAWSKYLTDAGFEVNPQPIIWDKESSTTKFSGYSYPSSYEPIIFAIKPPRTHQIYNPRVRNIIRCGRTSSGKKIHPFQKPARLIAQLVRDSTIEGMTVLDCFAASAITLAVSQTLKRSAIGFELSKEQWARSTMALEAMDYEGGAMNLNEIFPKK